VERVELSVKALRVLSMVEAASVTGPLKPLLIFSALTRDGFEGHWPLTRIIMTTRRIPVHALTEDRLYPAVKRAGIEYIPIPERRAFDATVLSKMHDVIVQVAPDIVETHDSKSHFLFFVLRIWRPALRKSRWIAFHHGYTRASRKVLLYQQLDRLTLRFADHVVTLCRPFASELQRRGVAHQRLSVMTNTAEMPAAPSNDEVARARQALGISDDERVVLSVGRLSREKGHEDLLKAFGITLESLRGASLRLLLVGDGPERERLCRLAQPYGRHVVFAGHVPDPWPLYHAADVFVLPSHSEGSPIVMLEAMAAGVPIVATCVGGIPEVLTNDESALLVPPRRVTQLSAALTAVLGDPALRSRLSGAASVVLTTLSPVAYARRLLQIYTRSVGTRAAP
jgi:glycosyltransferase involved in cell wall biosynthesis